MATTIFSDRFSQEYPGFNALDINKKTKDSELRGLSHELDRMVAEVRRVNAAIEAASYADIYLTITEHSDPKIGGALAGARDKATGDYLFENVQQVKEVMYPFSEFENLQRNVFNDTVRQISVSLASSRLINQFAVAGKGFREHAEYLHETAMKDLDRIIDTIDVDSVTSKKTDDASTETGAALFFERTDLEIAGTLTAQVYLSGTTSAWETVGSYSGSTNTAKLAADIADFINSLTLSSQTSNIIAAPVLSGEQQSHAIYFEARNFSTTASAELVCIKFSWSGANQRIPFSWGISTQEMASYEINSLLIATGLGKLSGEAATSVLSQNEGVPSVLYFRRSATNDNGEPVQGDSSLIQNWQQGALRFRVSPNQDQPQVIPIHRITNNDVDEQARLDNTRPSQVALALLNQLEKIKGDVKCLGAIIKSDPIDNARPVVALELIAYKLTYTDIWLILDILEIPKDIEMAVGDLRQPLTTFSNQPRSIRVEAKHDLSNRTPDAYRDESGDQMKPKLMARPPSSTAETIRSKLNKWYRNRY